nr:APC family permease [uncultured Rhodoferax sp.]
MSTPKITANRSLKKGHLSFSDVVAQAVGTIAPSGSPALVIPAVFATAGNGTWLAYLFATFALLILSLNINVFSSRSASPGSLYTFAGQGLGPFWGAVSGWSLLIAYLFTGAAVVAGSVYYFLVLLHQIAGDFSDLAASVVISLLLLVAAWYIAWKSIRLSTRVSLTVEGITIVAILAVVAGYFLHSGNWVDQSQIQLSGVTLDNARLGLVLAFFSFVGFESATVLGHEAKEPLRVIPRSVITTVLGIGIFFVLSSYALVAAFQGLVPDLGKTDAPVSALAASVGLGFLAPVVSLGVAASFFASALASINAAARVIYAFSHHGILHTRAGDAHHAHATPHIAVSAASIIVLILSLALTLQGIGLLDAFGYLGSVATFGFLVSYVLVSVGAPVFLKRRGELKPRHIVFSVSSVLLLAIPLFGVLYPVPPYPLNLLPYVFIGLLVSGLLYFLYVQRKSPDTLNLIEADLGKAAA